MTFREFRQIINAFPDDHMDLPVHTQVGGPEVEYPFTWCPGNGLVPEAVIVGAELMGYTVVDTFAMKQKKSKRRGY